MDHYGLLILMLGLGGTERPLSVGETRDLCARAARDFGVANRRVLLIAPDHTRSAPLAMLFPMLHALIAPEAAALDVIIALGTHPPMSDEAIDTRLGILPGERAGRYAGTRFLNHAWDDPAQLVTVGAIMEDEVEQLSRGLMRERVDVTINRVVFDYDLLLIVGPTFPHEVVGFSGGNKYLFPGISGPAIIDMFHWLGALITNASIIGTKSTPVRAVVDRAAAMVPIERRCVSLVVDDGALVGFYAGTPEEAWSAAADLSAQVHIRHEPRAFRSVLSCAPPMYDELWVGGKCAYKLEPVVADGGELIIYAPHITRVSMVHGHLIREIGYHVRDYFLARMKAGQFQHVPRGVIAHSTHVKGAGSYEAGVERPRIRVCLATGIGEDECRALNLEYRDPLTLRPDNWGSGADPDRLRVKKAGEILYRLASRKHDE